MKIYQLKHKVFYDVSIYNIPYYNTDSSNYEILKYVYFFSRKRKAINIGFRIL